MEQRQKERQSAMRDAAAQGSISDKVKQVGVNPHCLGIVLLHTPSAQCPDMGDAGPLREWSQALTHEVTCRKYNCEASAKRFTSSLVLKFVMSMQAAAVTLGIDPAEMGDGSSSFNQLGGDSLAAIQFAREVDELCGTTLPVSFVLDHSHSMQDIIEKVSCHSSLHASWALCADNLIRGIGEELCANLRQAVQLSAVSNPGRVHACQMPWLSES